MLTFGLKLTHQHQNCIECLDHSSLGIAASTRRKVLLPWQLHGGFVNPHDGPSSWRHNA